MGKCIFTNEETTSQFKIGDKIVFIKDDIYSLINDIYTKQTGSEKLVAYNTLINAEKNVLEENKQFVIGINKTLNNVVTKALESEKNKINNNSNDNTPSKDNLAVDDSINKNNQDNVNEDDKKVKSKKINLTKKAAVVEKDIPDDTTNDDNVEDDDDDDDDDDNFSFKFKEWFNDTYFQPNGHNKYLIFGLKVFKILLLISIIATVICSIALTIAIDPLFLILLFSPLALFILYFSMLYLFEFLNNVSQTAVIAEQNKEILAELKKQNKESN